MIDKTKPIEWVNSKDRFTVKPRLVPQIDVPLSKAMGFTVYQLDPRVIATISRWKKESNKPANSTVPDNFLYDPQKVQELRKILSNSI